MNCLTQDINVNNFHIEPVEGCYLATCWLLPYYVLCMCYLSLLAILCFHAIPKSCCIFKCMLIRSNNCQEIFFLYCAFPSDQMLLECLQTISILFLYLFQLVYLRLWFFHSQSYINFPFAFNSGRG